MEEKQEEALIKVVAYHHAITHKYNKKVYEREFKISSFVLGSMFDNTETLRMESWALIGKGLIKGVMKLA